MQRTAVHRSPLFLNAVIQASDVGLMIPALAFLVGLSYVAPPSQVTLALYLCFSPLFLEVYADNW